MRSTVRCGSLASHLFDAALALCSRAARRVAAGHAPAVLQNCPVQKTTPVWQGNGLLCTGRHALLRTGLEPPCCGASHAAAGGPAMLGRPHKQRTGTPPGLCGGFQQHMEDRRQLTAS